MKKLSSLVSALILLSLTILTALPPIHVANAQAFTRVGALTLSPGQNVLHASVIDPAAGFAYFGSVKSFLGGAGIVKVRLSDFTVDTALILNPGEVNVTT